MIYIKTVQLHPNSTVKSLPWFIKFYSIQCRKASFTRNISDYSRSLTNSYFHAAFQWMRNQQKLLIQWRDSFEICLIIKKHENTFRSLMTASYIWIFGSLWIPFSFGTIGNILSIIQEYTNIFVDETKAWQRGIQQNDLMRFYVELNWLIFSELIFGIRK